MSGYTEPEYTVERKAVIYAPGGLQTIELRSETSQAAQKEEDEMWARIIARTPSARPQSDASKRMTRYISIQGQRVDLLLRYQPHQVADIEADWTRVVKDARVDVHDLRCFEYVEWHRTGYTKAGTCIKY